MCNRGNKCGRSSATVTLITFSQAAEGRVVRTGRGWGSEVKHVGQSTVSDHRKLFLHVM